MSEEVETAVLAAIDVGYRLIDTAAMYKNEEAIGRALKKYIDAGKIKREELFIITKLPPHQMRGSDVGHALRLSLKKLQLDYVDLYLLHAPYGFENDGDEIFTPMNVDGLLK